MKKFSEAYAAARAALHTGALAPPWRDQQPALARLLGPETGPDPAQGHLLEALRLRLRVHLRVHLRLARRESGADAPGPARARALLEAAGDGPGAPARAAALAWLSHLYRETGPGGTALWVCAPPRAGGRWIFEDAAAGMRTLEDALTRDPTEIFSPSDRRSMGAALAVARDLVIGAAARLEEGGAPARDLVQRYFGGAGTPGPALGRTAAVLATGYRQIARACESGHVIVSGQPREHGRRGWKDWAFIYRGEALKVLYLQGAWLGQAARLHAGDPASMDRCARTIVHELSHKVLHTEDIAYGRQGLAPEGSTGLAPEQALRNADSWAFFAADLMDRLGTPDQARAREPCRATPMQSRRAQPGAEAPQPAGGGAG